MRTGLRRRASRTERVRAVRTRGVRDDLGALRRSRRKDSAVTSRGREALGGRGQDGVRVRSPRPDVLGREASQSRGRGRGVSTPALRGLGGDVHRAAWSRLARDHRPHRGLRAPVRSSPGAARWSPRGPLHRPPAPPRRGLRTQAAGSGPRRGRGPPHLLPTVLCAGSSHCGSGFPRKQEQTPNPVTH